MKFIAFFAFLASVSATAVQFFPNAECNGLEGSSTYDKCGNKPIPFYGGKTAALITDNKMGVVFYEKVDCTGEDYYKVRRPVPEKKCYDLEHMAAGRVHEPI